jgi:anthranilate phosphoribosyltransferase
VSSPALVEPFARVLRDLGSSRALVVHGQMTRGEGLEAIDELALGDNLVAELKDGQIHTYRLRPEEVGLEPAPYTAIGGGTAAENAAVARAILSGQLRGPKRDAVVLNAGAAFYLAGKSPSIAAGVKMGQALLDSGAGMEVLERLAKLTQA